MQSPLLQLVVASVASYFLPSFLVRIALGAVYSVFPGLERKPNHGRIAYTAIVCCYILYTFVSSYSSLPINHYDLLGVPPAAMTSLQDIDKWKEAVLRPRWLTLVKTYHPDKHGGSERAQAVFRQLQQAHEILKNDQLVKAYERFGSDLFTRLPPQTGRAVITPRDMFTRGVMGGVGWYIVAVVIFIIGPAFGSSKHKCLFWRLTTLALLLSCELSLLVSPSTVHPLPAIPGPVPSFLLTYELVTLMRQAWFCFNLGLSHLAPLYAPPATPTQSEALAEATVPYLRALTLNNQATAQALDSLLAKAITSKADKEKVIDRIIDDLGKI